MIALAYDVAERQMLDGSVSSQVLTQFLKLGTEQARLERIKLQKETELLCAKKTQIESAERVEHLYEDAMIAMQSYKVPDSDED